jgi:hypothetical protein
MEQALEGGESLHRVKRGRPSKQAMQDLKDVTDYLLSSTPEQLYADRVWAGQSVDVPPAERKERVFNALRGQNLPTDGITFP